MADGSRSLLRAFEALARAARGEKDPLVGRGDVVAQARVIEALLASAEAGEPVELRA